MRGLASWLDRLRASEHANLVQHFLRVFVPGIRPLDIDKWVVATDPQGPLISSRVGSPEAWSVLRVCDHAGRPAVELEKLSAEMAALISLALDRRVDIPFEVSIGSEGSDRIVFAPYADMIDRSFLGPIPIDSLPPIRDLLSRVCSLNESDQITLGDAMSLLHGAMLLFDREARSAYTLLIAGIEVLSREYGRPPQNWDAWDDHSQWDTLFAESDLSAPQTERVRAQLMRNRQLRLKATFRAYASERVPETFWDTSYDDWTYAIDITTGLPHDSPSHEIVRIQDILQKDRQGLASALGKSYDLRSRFVHEGHWLSLPDLVLPLGRFAAWNRPLPFNVLRLLLAELIRTELAARSTVKDLPAFSISRSSP